MTTEQLSKLTPEEKLIEEWITKCARTAVDEEKRVKIAEHFGWKLIDMPHHPNGHKVLWMTPKGEQLNLGTPDALPDYLNDLNAALTLIDLRASQGWLCNLANGLDKTWECEFMRARGEKIEIQYSPADTLAQAIADAFLLTI